MKTILAGFLMLVSTSLLADKPACTEDPGGCVGNPPGNAYAYGRQIAQVPEPGILALIGLGAAGLVVARKRRR